MKFLGTNLCFMYVKDFDGYNLFDWNGKLVFLIIKTKNMILRRTFGKWDFKITCKCLNQRIIHSGQFLVFGIRNPESVFE